MVGSLAEADNVAAGPPAALLDALIVEILTVLVTVCGIALDMGSDVFLDQWLGDGGSLLTGLDAGRRVAEDGPSACLAGELWGVAEKRLALVYAANRVTLNTWLDARYEDIVHHVEAFLRTLGVELVVRDFRGLARLHGGSVSVAIGDSLGRRRIARVAALGIPADVIIVVIDLATADLMAKVTDIELDSQLTL